jgi:hypothetical protein
VLELITLIEWVFNDLHGVGTVNVKKQKTVVINIYIFNMMYICYEDNFYTLCLNYNYHSLYRNSLFSGDKERLDNNNTLQKQNKKYSFP